MALEINHTVSTLQTGSSPVMVMESKDGPYWPTYSGHDNSYIQQFSNDPRWTQWDLDKNMKIVRTAADFYLLYDLYIDELDEGHFQQLMVKANKVSSIPEPLFRAIMYGKNGVEKTQFEISSNRHQAWNAWKYFRRQYGNIALTWAEDTFVLFKGNGFGGPRWANIAKTLRHFVTGEYSPIMFIDTCWGLQHNGGSYFNKAWTTTGIATVLNYNQNEQLDHLLFLHPIFLIDYHVHF